MKRKRLINIISCIFMLILLVPSQVVLGATTQFEFDRNQVRVKTKDTFTLDLLGEEVRNLYGFEAVLSFDESKLAIVNTPSVDFEKGFTAGPTRATDGKVYFAFTKIGQQPGEKGTMRLAQFKFKAKEAGNHTIRLESIKIIDSNQNAKQFKVGQTIHVRALGNGNSSNHQDIGGHWAEKCIREIVDYGYMIGKSDTLFKPNDKLTRAEMATILNNIMEQDGIGAGVNEEKGEVTLTDIEPNQWYTDNVLKMASRGLLKGYEDGTFKPQKHITRAETLSLLARIEKSNGTYTEPKEIEKILAPYKDAVKVPNWARKDVAWAIEKGLIIGNEKGEINSEGDITRAEIAVILCKYLVLELHQ